MGVVSQVDWNKTSTVVKTMISNWVWESAGPIINQTVLYVFFLLSWLSSSFCKTDPVNNDRGKLQSLQKCQQYFSATRHENVSRNCAKIYVLDGIGANYFLETRNWWFSTQGSIVIDRTQLQLTYAWPQTTCFCVRADRASKYPPSHILMLKPTGEKIFSKYHKFICKHRPANPKVSAS